MTGLRGISTRLRRSVPESVKRTLRRSPLVNRLLPPLTGGDVPVRLAIGDLVRPGDCTFDVGANVGSFTVLMGRAVGRAGHVHAFEPNPTCAGHIAASIQRNGLKNCTVVTAAAYDADLEEIDFYVDGRHETHGVASTVVPHLAVAERLGQGFPSVRVRAVQLDTYCASTGAEPDLVKIDVEGAERHVLDGFARYMEARRPHVIVEYGATASMANPVLESLEQRGYALIDLHEFARVRAADYAGRALFRNMLAIHTARLAATPYAHLTSQHVATIDGTAFGPYGTDTARRAPVRLPAGRYVASYAMTGPDAAEVALWCSGPDGGLDGARGSLGWISLGLHHLVFALPRTSDVQLHCDARADVVLDRVTIRRVALQEQ
jgi:FkbM family methyltransferase